MPLMLNFVPMPQSSSGNLLVSVYPPADQSQQGYRVLVAARRITPEETDSSVAGSPPEDVKVAELGPAAKALVDDVTPPGERRWYGVALIAGDGTLKPARFKVAEGDPPPDADLLSGGAPAPRAAPRPAAAPAAPRPAAATAPRPPGIAPMAPRPPGAPAMAPRPPGVPGAPMAPRPPVATGAMRAPAAAPPAGVDRAPSAGVRLSDLAATAAEPAAPPPPPARRAEPEADGAPPPPRREAPGAQVAPASSIPMEAQELKMTGATQTWDGLRIWWDAAGGLTGAYEVVIADHTVFPEEVPDVFADTVPTAVVRAHSPGVTCVIDNVTPQEARAYYAVFARSRDKKRVPIAFHTGDAAASGHTRAPFAVPDKLEQVRGQAEGQLREAKAQLHWAKQDQDEGARREALRICNDVLTLYPDYPPAKALLAEIEAARAG